MMRKNVVLLCALSAALAAAGCSKSDRPWEVVPVSGTVTHEGQPVPGLIVEFQPEQGRPSQARTDENGRFVLNYTIHEQGAQVGTHQVTFSWADQHEGDTPSPDVTEIIKRHGRDGTPVTIEVTGQTDDLQIALPQ